MSQPQLVSLVSEDRRLAVEFSWIGDRFEHQFLLDGTPVGGSVEGEPDVNWPPSPPIQQISCEQIEGRPVILGVGSAGSGHWSISVEALATGEIRFELACRSNDRPAFLGSTYRHDPSIAMFVSHDQADLRSQTEGARAVRTVVDVPSMTTGTHRWAYTARVT